MKKERDKPMRSTHFSKATSSPSLSVSRFTLFYFLLRASACVNSDKDSN